MVKIRRQKFSHKLEKVIKKRQKKALGIKKVKITKTKKKGFWHWTKKLTIFLIIVGLLLAGAFLIWASQLKIPSMTELENLKMSQATKIYDRTGKIVLYNIYEDERRTIIPLSKMSTYLQKATIAIEDKNFYEHDGVELYHLITGNVNSILNGTRMRGASTITQQVVKQTILTRERTIERKVKEWILSWRLEGMKTRELGSKKAAKDSILEIYLNENPYGGTIHGVEEASLFYFGKHASEVTIAEAAYLASMPQAPTTYSPYGKHRNALEKRKNAVLFAMLNQGYINLDQYNDAKKEEVKFLFKKKDSGIKAPHFVMYIKQLLAGMFDSETIKTGGLKVYTSLDYDLQEKMQAIVKKNVDEAIAKKLDVSNGAVVAINPSTGEILSMVGSRNYFSKEIDGKFNVAMATRQPGSTFKPFAYVTAFQRGYTPKTVLWDVQTEFSDACGPDLKDESGSSKPCYHPYNFDHKFKGHILMEQALPESRNVPAVKTLYLAGLNSTLKNIKLMGITSLNKPANHYGLSLVLGVGEVKLTNLVSAYGVFANKGVRVPHRAILRIEDDNGEEIYKSEPRGEKVIGKNESLMISRILSDNKLKYPTFGWNSPLYFTDRQVASKTGTTSDDKDFWVVGFDPGHIALGAWLGNNDNKPGKGHANYYVKKIWRESMNEALKNIPKTEFEKADEDFSEKKPVLRGVWQGNKVLRIDTQTNGIATDNTPEEYIREVPIPDYHSILYWLDPKNPDSPTPENKDHSFDRWEGGVQNWIQEHSEEMAKYLDEDIKNILDLNISSDENGQENGGENEDGTKIEESDNDIDFKILSPGESDLYRKDEKMFLNLKEKSGDIKSYKIFINGKIVGTTRRQLNIKLSEIDFLKKENILKIVGISNKGQAYKIIHFSVKD